MNEENTNDAQSLPKCLPRKPWNLQWSDLTLGNPDAPSPAVELPFRKRRRRKRLSPEVRFWRHVEKTETCWIWTGAKQPQGWGVFVSNTDKTNGAKLTLAHRYSYELHHGSLPEGEAIAHTCGNPACVNPEHLYVATVIQRFWRNVHKTDTCWEWQGGRCGKYGQFSRLGRNMGAHRYSYELHRGPVTDGLHVCHKCDNPICVNPGHLFLGTAGDNVADMVSKDRHAKGEGSGRHKLSTEDALMIRRMVAGGGMTFREIARCYGRAHNTIADIAHRRTWRHLP